MHINITYDVNFTELMLHLKSKYGQRLFDLDGIGSQLDIDKFSKGFFINSSTTADVSVDSNSNVSTKDMIVYNTELPKPYFRMNAYYLIWKKLRQLYGHAEANRIIEMQLTGDFYINDLHGVSMPYCYNYSTYDIALAGLTMVNKIKSIPPKHLYSFKSQLEQFVVIASNSTLGACLYKDQHLLIREGGLIKSIDIKSFVDRFNLNNKFTFNGDVWNTSNTLSDIEVWEDGKFVDLRRVYKRKYNKKIYKVKTHSGKKCFVSEDHIFKVLFRGREIEVKAKDLEVGDTVFNTFQKHLPIDKNSFDYKMGQFIGILNGDGYLGKPELISISINYKEKYIANFLDEFLLNYFDLKGKLTKGNKCYQYNIYSTKFRNKIVDTYFKDNIVHENKYAEVMNKSVDFKLGYVDGLLITDGGYRKGHTLALISKKTIDNVNDILCEVGFKPRNIHTTAYDTNKKDLYTVQIPVKINKYLDLTLIKRSSLKIDGVNNVEVFYTGKKAYYQASSKKLKNDMVSTGDITEERKKLYCKLTTDVITDIKFIENDDDYVYEIETSSHWYSAGGILTHNCGLADLPIVLGYYVDKILETKSDAGFNFVTENDCWRYVKENLVSFIYTINQPSRASQSPFTNISLFDDGFLNSLAPEYVFSDGKVPKIGTIKKIQELFIDTMNDELRRTPVTFPVTTACFSVDDEGNVLDEAFLEMISEKNMEYGFINIYCGKTSTLSSCCRLRSDTNSEYFNSFGSGSSKIGCYDDKTEVLTSNGWKLFKDVDIDSDKIYTMDEYKNPSFDKASEYHEYDYEGDLISFKNKSTDLLVTPNHRMVLDSKKTDKIFIKRADEIENNLQVSIPMSLPYNSLVIEELYFTIPSLKIKNKSYPEVKINYNDWVKFMGIYLSEGCCDKDGNKNNHGNERYRITISQNKEAKPIIYNEIYKLLEKLPYKFYAFDNGFEINNKPLCLYLRQFGDHSDKFVPEDIKYLPKQYLDSFWEWLVKGDGHIISTGTEMYWTTSKQLNDDIQMIMALMGYRSRSEIVEKKDAVIKGRLISKENVKDCYRSIKYIRTNNAVKKHQISRKLYSGKVYCLSVPNGTLFVRRNGKVAWSGNSLGVVTVNLPRLAYKYKDNEEKFFEVLEDTVEVVAKVNNSKRHIIKRRIENGAQPLYDLGFMDINKQYSTCGLNGINEAITIMGYDVLHNGGVDFGLKMLDVINTTNDRLQKQYKAPHNCEQTPSENSSIKLADKDKLLGIDLGYNLYSNQFIPLTTKADLLDRIKLQGIFDKHFSGGSICHLNIEERITEKEHIMELIRSCAKKGVIYFAINYNLQRCEDFHMTVGRNTICSICGKPIEENFTRVVG